MNHTTADDTAPEIVECAAMYHADVTRAFAFVFAIPSTSTRFTLHSRTVNRYEIGEHYRLMLAPAEVVPVPLALQDAEFLRHCLDTAARQWAEAATDPAAQRLYAAKLDHVQHLITVIDQHLDQAPTDDDPEEQQ